MQETETAEARPRRPANGYYTILAGIMLALGLLAFSDNLVTDVGQRSNSDPWLVIHGLFAFAWMAALVVQANFVRKANLARHRKVGPCVFAIGAGLVVSTAYLFYAGFEGFGSMEATVLANRIVLPIFAIALVYAWRMRFVAAWHKRLIVLGTILTLSPILFRVLGGALDILFPGLSTGIDTVFIIVVGSVWTAILASHWIYDLKVLRRVHPLTIGATATVYGVYAFVFAVA
ncbi:hypothetical protein A6F68_00912 [Tsuneonella dongtanensis]|uniref:Uncharacterized protein n=1 Tax=Tsuneonella dongtanensis TaxID=692370 RepID=A0A1B2ABH8_9SPHN|nr:hypothetical protein [Tsuneonella dongtanensis]ANY19438.1 hypothetical protein A6F68_00912 [Tsuneonella dongtanensis]